MHRFVLYGSTSYILQSIQFMQDETRKSEIEKKLDIL